MDMAVSQNLVHRRRALAALLTERGADAMLVSDLTDVRYLSGFTGSNGSVLIWADDAGEDPLISTDGRYTEQVAAQAPELTARIARNTVAELARAAAAARPGLRLAFDADALSYAQYRALADDEALSGVDLVPTAALVTGLRAIKDDGEVVLVTEACRIADEALAALLERGAVAPGRTERQVARNLEWEMYARGAQAIAFETIVAAGPNSAVPHHRPTDAVLASGDLVKMDFGAVYQGYHSDITRTVVLGPPQPWQREIYQIVATAQQAGRDALTPGAALADVDAAARRLIEDAGYGEYYVHGLGHGVGLQIHEAPPIGATATGTLPLGATVTVEPGIYLPGRGGVRIEDTLVVTETGSRLLTTTPRDLRIL